VGAAAVDIGQEAMEAGHVIAGSGCFERFYAEDRITLGVEVDVAMRFQFGLNQKALLVQCRQLIQEFQEFAFDPRRHDQTVGGRRDKPDGPKASRWELQNRQWNRR
jgi:hypothetical protein